MQSTEIQTTCTSLIGYKIIDLLNSTYNYSTMQTENLLILRARSCIIKQDENKITNAIPHLKKLSQKMYAFYYYSLLQEMASGFLIKPWINGSRMLRRVLMAKNQIWQGYLLALTFVLLALHWKKNKNGWLIKTDDRNFQSSYF